MEGRERGPDVVSRAQVEGQHGGTERSLWGTMYFSFSTLSLLITLQLSISFLQLVSREEHSIPGEDISLKTQLTSSSLVLDLMFSVQTKTGI